MDQASSLRKIVTSNALNHKKKLSMKKSSKENSGQENSGQENSEGSSRVIAVTSGKGGVGKTNIVANLAMAFTSLGKKVMILDADLGLANIDIIFGINPPYNIGHVISGEKELPEVIVQGHEGIRIIPAGSGFANLTHLEEGQKLNLLNEFETLDEIPDVFLIDTGAGISSNVLYFNLAADECIVVSTLEPTSITDAYAMMKVMFNQHGLKHFKLLVNMVKDGSEAKQVYRTLTKTADRHLNGVGIEYIGFIPRDENIVTAVRNRTTVMNLFPDAESSKSFKKIAGSLLNTPRRFDSDGNITFFLNRFFEYKIKK